MLSPETLPAIQAALRDGNLDGWLLFDFRGLNPIAGAMMGLDGMTTRRAFALVPRDGTPTALTHAIEQGPWRHWPSSWRKETYSSWRTLESMVAELVRNKKVAMEYSPGDAVPYLDRIPAGVLEMVRSAGATVVTSSELVARFYAGWSARHAASHSRAAEQIARIARDAFALAGQRARTASPMHEHELMAWIRERFAEARLTTDHGPNVSAGDHAANPHYEPSADNPRPIHVGDVVLIDLWAKEDDGIYADQTWMASVGPASPEATNVWNAVRDARDAAISLVTSRIAAQQPVRGADADDAARKVITDRGFGEFFTHRTGHSIDSRELHGSGPNLDNLESRDDRLLVPGIGFSIEPGIYVPGKIGMRSEVNVYVERGRAVVTPKEIQRELFIV